MLKILSFLDTFAPWCFTFADLRAIILEIELMNELITAGEVNYFLGIVVSESEHVDKDLKNLPSAI